MMASNNPPDLTADSSFRNPLSAYNASQDTIISDYPPIAQLQALSPGLKIYTRSSPSFARIRTVYQLNNNSQPLAICRPSTPIQVATIITFCTSTRIPLTVRSGGHDDAGRPCIQDGIVIDMREMDGITLSPDKLTASIGGGTLALNLARFLYTHGLVAAVGECSSVGVVNWAACGGYGILNGSFGLGVDQIVGARVVNAEGEVVDADQEMLWGIRGAGGNFGVIVELMIKVHALSSMLAGFIAFPFKEARKVLSGYQSLLDEEFPDPWSGALGVFRMPGLGSVVLFFATWSSSDLESGTKFIDRVRGLGVAVVDTVTKSK
jgi:FAD/FMN-containing dehydrogenase